LFIGNGTVEEGAPSTGVTEILTEHSDVLSLSRSYTFKGLLAGFVVQTGPDANNPVIRTLQDKLDDFVSVRDFGAIGDGVADDTAAIQRALDNPLGTATAGGQNSLFHRTVYFPAGEYLVSDTIKVPPYTRLQGEGKSTTTIIARSIPRKETIVANQFYADQLGPSLGVQLGDSIANVYYENLYTNDPVNDPPSPTTYLLDTGPIIKFVDSAGQSGQLYWRRVNGVRPYSLEYHLSDMGFAQRATAFNQPIVQADGGTTFVFKNCLFQGELIDYDDDGQTVDNYYTNRIDPGVDISIAAVLLTGWSDFKAIRDVRIHDCEITRMNYGIQTFGEVRTVEVTNSYFDQCYHHINLGGDNPPFQSYYDYLTIGAIIEGNYFRFSGDKSILVGDSTKSVSSVANIFSGAGYGYRDSDGPLVPAIEFNSDGHSSIGDQFDNYLATDYGYPDIETNGYNCLIVGDNRNGITTGLATERRAVSVTLDDAASETTVGVPYLDYGISTNLTLNYTVTHNGEVRNGVLRVNNNSGTVTWDDEYNESGDVAFSLSANATTGDIEYTSDAVGDDAVMTYKINYLIVP
jgi:hypothetical protein